MESKIKFIKIRTGVDIPDIKEVIIEHKHMPQYNKDYIATSTLDNTVQSYLSTRGNWLPINYSNEISPTGKYDIAILYVNDKVSYKLTDIFIDSNAKEIIFNHAEAVFNI